jgi:hypothetical protein
LPLPTTIAQLWSTQAPTVVSVQKVVKSKRALKVNDPVGPHHDGSTHCSNEIVPVNPPASTPPELEPDALLEVLDDAVLPELLEEETVEALLAPPEPDAPAPPPPPLLDADAPPAALPPLEALLPVVDPLAP